MTFCNEIFYSVGQCQIVIVSCGTVLDSDSKCGNCQTAIANCGTVPDSDRECRAVVVSCGTVPESDSDMWDSTGRRYRAWHVFYL